MHRRLLGRLLCLFFLLEAGHVIALAQYESGLEPRASSVSSAAYYYISKAGEITMPLNLWGEVRLPGRYEVPISTDLVQLISFAGGPLSGAKMSAVKITRIERREDEIRKVEFSLDLEHLDKIDTQTLSLRPGDTIYIERTAFAWPDAINLLTAASTVAIAVATVLNLSK
jgi:hypothetical protein